MNLTLLSLLVLSQYPAVWNNGVRVHPQAGRINLNGDVSCTRLGYEADCRFTNPASDGGKVGEAFMADAAITAQMFDHNPGDCTGNEYAIGINADGSLVCFPLVKVAEAYAADASITAQYFDHDPNDCAPGDYAQAISPSGDLSCGVVTYAQTTSLWDHNPAACPIGEFAKEQDLNGDFICAVTPKVAEAYMADASITAQMLDHDPPDCDVTKREYALGIVASGAATCSVFPLPVTCSTNEYLSFLNVNPTGGLSTCSPLPNPAACAAGDFYTDLSAAGVSTCTTLPVADSSTFGTVKLTGDLGGTGGAVTVTDDGHNHTGATISALDTADITTGTLPGARGGLGGAQSACVSTEVLTCDGTSCTCVKTWAAARGGLGTAQPTCSATQVLTCNGTNCTCTSTITALGTLSHARGAGGTVSAPNNTPTLVPFTEVYDTLGEYAATGRFTAISAGYYHYSSSVLMSSAAWPVNRLLYIILYKNGGFYQGSSQTITYAAITATLTVNIAGTILLAPGDIIDIRVQHTQGAALSVFNDSNWTYFHVDRLL